MRKQLSFAPRDGVIPSIDRRANTAQALESLAKLLRNDSLARNHALVADAFALLAQVQGINAPWVEETIRSLEAQGHEKLEAEIQRAKLPPSGNL